jgi:hypothetical protein
MSKITTLRESFETKLDQWQAATSALEAQFELTRDKALDRVENEKQHYRDVLQRMKSKIENSSDIADNIKSKISTQIDEMQVQLVLGKAEAKDAFEDQKNKIQAAIGVFEKNMDKSLDAMDKKMDSALDVIVQETVKVANKLDAELEAMQAHYEIEKAKTREMYDAKKSEITSRISQFMGEIKDKKQLASDKASTFEKDMSAGFENIKQAFSNLLH